MSIDRKPEKQLKLAQLRTRLRADSGKAPAFSPLLHERVMQTLRKEGRKSLIAVPEDRGAWRLPMRFGLPTAVAAAAAIATWMLLSPGNGSGGGGVGTPRNGDGLVSTRPLDPTPDLNPSQLPNLLDLASASKNVDVDSAKYAYLDRDVQRLALFVAHQIPALPEDGR